MKRQEIIDQLQQGRGNLHYVSDMRWILAQNRPDIEERIMAGTLEVQGALRELGRFTQRERNRARAQKVRALCVAVLRNDYPTAENLAVELIGKELDQLERKNKVKH